MIAQLSKVLAIEVTTNEKGYKSIQVYEMGKGSYGFRTVNIKDAQLPSVQPFLGKLCDLEITLFEGMGKTGKYMSYNFHSVSAVK